MVPPSVLGEGWLPRFPSCRPAPGAARFRAWGTVRGAAFCYDWQVIHWLCRVPESTCWDSACSCHVPELPGPAPGRLAGQITDRNGSHRTAVALWATS